MGKALAGACRVAPMFFLYPRSPRCQWPFESSFEAYTHPDSPMLSQCRGTGQQAAAPAAPSLPSFSGGGAGSGAGLPWRLPT